MSALGSKAERQAKPRFQSLDINSLYRTSRGESLEPLAQKSSVPRKHGMQSLGKVPTARRPPANLPSLRAETTTPSGNITDPNSWGGETKPTTSTPTPISTTATTSQSSITTQGGPQATWSAVAVGTEAISQPPTYQSPQFQHEFPSLDGNTPNTTQKPGPDVQYGPGPSLRPQTEGSWMQGGSRSGNTEPPTATPATIGASTAVPALQQVPPHLRNLMPPFMYRGSGGGNFVMAQNYVPGASPPTRTTARQQSSQSNTYNESQPSRERRTVAPRRENDVNESPLQRPIIKEEDLDKMEDIARDVGWAGHDDIDYNQKLAFSDDESSEPSPKERHTPTMIQQSLEIINKTKTTTPNREEESRWNQQRDRPVQLEFRQNGHLGPRGIIEEEEVWIQRRRQQSEEVAVAVERAKQRREEEERKFLESRQAAAKKLQELEQKLNAKKGSENKEVSEESLNAPDTLDFHHLTQIGDGRAFLERSHGNRDRENNRETVRDNRDNLRGSRDSLREGNREYKEINRERDIRIERSERVDRETGSENRSFERESKNRENVRIERDVQSRERDNRLDNLSRPQDGPNFSRQFQSNLPPRFQKQQAERNHSGAQNYDRNSRANSNNNTEKSHSIPFAQQYDPRWVHPPQSYIKSSGATIVRRNQQEDRGQQNQSEERFVRQASNQSLHRSISDSSQRKLSTSSDDKNSVSTQPEPVLKMDTSPVSEATDFSGSWADEPFENEKLFEPKIEESKPEETEDIETESEKVELIIEPIQEPLITKVLDNIENSSENTVKIVPVAELSTVTLQSEKHEIVKVSEKLDKDVVNEDIRSHKKSSPRGRIDHNRGSSRGAYAVFRGGNSNSNWGRRGTSRLGIPRSNSNHSGLEYTWSETDGSTEEIDDDRKNNKVSKSRREETNIRRSDSNTQKTQREGFAPRGEPSRRGRGGFRARGATLGKRMDGYGPPSSKSPFGGDEKPKDISTDGLTPDDRTKLKQQALSAGIIGSARGATKISAPPRLRSTGRTKQSGKCVQSDEAWETTSEHSDSQEKSNKNGRANQAKCLKSINQKASTERKPMSVSTSSTPTKNSSKVDPPKTLIEQQNFVKKDALEGIDLNNFASVVVVDEQPEENLNAVNPSDIDGFQEVRSKKTAKEFRKDEPQFSQPSRQGVVRHEKDKKERPLSKSSIKISVSTNKTNTTPAVVVAPIVIKSQIERPRQNSKLPPRFAKQKENIRMQRAQAQEMNVLAPMPPVNAWDKPITASLRSTLESDAGINITLEGNDGTVLLAEGSPSGNSSQRSTPGGHIEKAPVSKTSDVKSVLDGTSPPVNTIIFENTNYKSGPPGVKRLEKRDAELFKNSSLDMIENVNRDTALASLPLSFPKNETDYEKDMKLAFTFDSDLSQLTDDKSSKGLGLSRAMTSSVQSTISPSTAELNLKIQSVKKVWESVPVMPTVLEHNSNDENQHNINSSHNLATHNHNMTSQHQINTSQHNLKHSPMSQSHANQMSVSQHNLTQAHNLGSQHPLTLTSQHNLSQSHNLSPANSYAGNFGGDPNLEHFSKDGPDGEGGYSPSPQHVVSAGHYNQHGQQNVLNKHGEVLGNTNVCKVKPTQQTMHPSGIGGSIGGGGQGSQQGLGLSPPPTLQTNALQAPPPYYQANQFGGMSAIPSPPAMLFNSSQAMLGSNQIPSQQGLYGTFQLEQGRSGFSQFPGPYGGGSAQYNYMQTPPSMPATPDMYQNITSQYRMGGAPFGQSQQINNPSTVLISSTSNSLMSASVKPSSQQIGAIGSKTGTVGQHYNQQYAVAFAPGPQGPIQNNSYYTGGSQGVGGSQGGFYQQGGSQGFSLPANMFNNNQPPPQAPVQSFGSQFLSSPLQLAAAAMQQYRAPQSAYLKGQSTNHLPDSCSRQLKSPIGDPLGPLKQAPPQPSPPQHKGYPTSVLQQGSGGRPGSLSRGSGGPPRYPAPIQRPTGYPTSANGGISNRGQRHPHGGHAHTQQGPVKHYYSRGSQGSSGNSEQPGKSVEKNDGTQVNNNQTDNNKDESNNE